MIFSKALLLWLGAVLLQTPVDVRLDSYGQGKAIRVTGWSDAERFRDQWNEILNVYVDSGVSDLPPINGERVIEGPDLIFVPRYGLQQGLRYRVVVQIPGRPAVTRLLETPKPDTTPTTTVEHIYPSVTLLPENQLKFYIHFSASMSRGEAYRRIQLLDEAGKPVRMPFLELEQELWDVQVRRLTLFFDPGRIKRDILPNQEMGPPITAGRQYTLVISSEWRDAENKTLVSETRKTFKVGPPDRKPLDLNSWKILAPAIGTTSPLFVDFAEPLDHALLMRQLEVIDSNGQVVEGRIEIERDETRWSFTPNAGWKPGRYGLRVGTNIADLAGNMIDRPFEVDRFDTVTERITRETRILPFTLK